MSENYPCACGCGTVIDFAGYGKRRIWASEACRVRQYRRDHPDYVQEDKQRNRRRSREAYTAVERPTECLCGCGGELPLRAGTRGRHPLYASEACRRRARKAAA
jgi:hypothetical protein